MATLKTRDVNQQTGTIVTTIMDKQGRDVKLTLERRKPKLPEGEGHIPWEYQLEQLTFERGGKTVRLDAMNPAAPQ